MGGEEGVWPLALLLAHCGNYKLIKTGKKHGNR